jgi:demethylmenaquinone methyltransferase/2-methoxy-6-polyprenyl-1,4-benzoquinol methylase
MPFRQRFDCLWCGRAWEASGPDDLAGWAHLCVDCLGRAGDNPFLAFRVRSGLRDRAGGSTGGVPDPGAPVLVPEPPGSTPEPPGSVPQPPGSAPARPGSAPQPHDKQLRAYYAARAPEYDDWYLRRGRYSRGPVVDLAWQYDLDAATQWLDGLPLRGEILELAAGTGWWSPLLAQKGQLSITDVNEEPLELARSRLVAHGLRAHLHVRDAWAEPDRPVDALFCAFWLSHVPRERLGDFLRIARAWLAPGGTFAFIDSRPDPQSGAVDQAPPADDLSLRRLADGREFLIPKVFYTPDELRSALMKAGFHEPSIKETPRFFLLGSASVSEAPGAWTPGS